MRCSPNYVTSDEADGENDNPLIFLYFGVQALQTLRQCKQNNAKLQKWKIYFPIMFAWEKASTRIQRWWLWRHQINSLNKY
jgi:hypothetical protein